LLDLLAEDAGAGGPDDLAADPGGDSAHGDSARGDVGTGA